MEEYKPLPDFYVNATPPPVQEIDQDKYLNLTFRYKGEIYRTKLHPGQEEFYRTLIEQVNKS
ncbi:hypothetical protein GCM10028817_22310 [Spirosoma pomorum]